MTDIEQKALALLNEVAEERMNLLAGHIDREITSHEALCRAIEQHEAFKQKVSYAIEDVTDRDLPVAVLRRFVIELDPLDEIMGEFLWSPKATDDLRAALEARGLEIRRKTSDR
jgi:hypothetical protein